MWASLNLYRMHRLCHFAGHARQSSAQAACSTSRFKIRSMSFLWLQTSCSQTRSPCQLFILTKQRPAHGFHGVCCSFLGLFLALLFGLRVEAPKRKSAATMV